MANKIIAITSVSLLLSCTNLMPQNIRQSGLILEDTSVYNSIPVTEDIVLMGEFIPSTYDLSDFLPPPGNQGTQRSGTAWAIAYVYRSYLYKQSDNIKFIYPNGSLDSSTVFSPAFIYNLVNHNRSDSGMTICRGLNLLRDTGVVKLSDFKYNENDFNTIPKNELIERANNFRINKFSKVDSSAADESIRIEKFKTTISNNILIIAGMKIDDSLDVRGDRFYKENYNNIANENKAREFVWENFEGNSGGYHAFVIVGYDNDLKGGSFKLINSWGNNWGNKGFFWIPYRFFFNHLSENYIINH